MFSNYEKVFLKFRLINLIYRTAFSILARLVGQQEGHPACPVKKHCRINSQNNKKAVLSQRWPRNAPYTWVHWKFSGLPDYAHGYYSQHFHGLLFGSTLWMFLQNLKCAALSVPQISTQKNLDSLWIRPRSFFSKIFNRLLFRLTL